MRCQPSSTLLQRLTLYSVMVSCITVSLLSFFVPFLSLSPRECERVGAEDVLLATENVIVFRFRMCMPMHGSRFTYAKWIRGEQRWNEAEKMRYTIHYSLNRNALDTKWWLYGAFDTSGALNAQMRRGESLALDGKYIRHSISIDIVLIVWLVRVAFRWCAFTYQIQSNSTSFLCHQNSHDVVCTRKKWWIRLNRSSCHWIWNSKHPK